MKRIFGQASLSELCESALSQLEGHDLERAQVDEKALLEGKIREELYIRLKQQLESFCQTEPVAEAVAVATEKITAAKEALAVESQKKATPVPVTQKIKATNDHDGFLRSIAAFKQEQKSKTENASSASSHTPPLSQLIDTAAELDAFR
ncbi:MAG: hypothetical protein AB7N80_10935 [Bdellovibrionales bacterium]